MSNGFRPVTLLFANLLGSDPAYLPGPGDDPVLGVAPPVYAGDGTRYLMPDGSAWEYAGISGMDADNRERINGWRKVGLATIAG